jgi:hypothetical protein
MIDPITALARSCPTRQPPAARVSAGAPSRFLETIIVLGNHYSASFAGDASYLTSSATTPAFRFF